MNIVFINSPLQDYGKFKKKNYYTTPPLGLGYLATIAKNMGNKVSLIDSEALGLSPNEIVLRTLKHNPDIVGINLLAPTLKPSKHIICKLKAKNPKIKIFVGGPYATISPDHVLKDIPQVDILFRGEGELTLKEILEKKKLSSIKAISYIQNGKIMHNQDRPLNHDLDSLPFIDRNFFVNDPCNEERKLKATIIGSRGCPYFCTFCSAPSISGKKIRARSIKNIVDEIELLKQKYNIDSVHFIDNDFIYDKKRILKFVDELESRGLKINWRALVRVDVISKLGKQFLERIKQAGCYQLVFGIESGTQRILDLIKKNTTIEQARETIRLCKEAGIKTKAYYMFGFPTETWQEMEQTLEHAKELNTDTACFLLVKAYPGTEMYNSLIQKYGENELQRYMHLQEEVPLDNVSSNRNFDKYHISNEISFSQVSTGDLREILRKAYKTYYNNERDGIKHQVRELVAVQK